MTVAMESSSDTSGGVVQDVGITMNDVNPDYVVVGEGRSYSLDTLTKATNLVLKGAKIEKYKKCLTSTNSPDILYNCCGERKQHGFLKRNSKK